MSVTSSCAANTHRAARQGAPNVRKSASIFRLHRYRILLFYLLAYNYFHEKITITHLLYALIPSCSVGGGSAWATG